MRYLIIALTLLMIADIETVSAGVSKGIEVCVFSIIPSLLIFFVMSDIILKINSKRKISPKWMAFFLGSVCGFPIGAHVCSELYLQGKISEKDNQKLLPICNNTSPAYVIGAIGVSMLGNKGLGMLLYFSEFISALLFLIPIKCKNESSYSEYQKISIKDILLESIEKAGTSILKICTLVCSFSGLLALISKYSNNAIKAVFSILLEISNAATVCTALFSWNPLLAIALLSFICSWAGMCVHLQVLTAQRSIKVKYFPFALTKFFQGILSAIIALAGYKILYCT